MKRTAVLVAAAIAAATLMATWPAGATDNQPAAPAAFVTHDAHLIPAAAHRVAFAQVRAVEAVRGAVWACQRGLKDVPLRRAALNRTGLEAAGWRYLLWIKAQWNGELAGCQQTAGSRAAVVSRLRAGLAGYPLEQWAGRFEQAGRRWNVSPYLMAAISGTESTYGLAVTPGNAWGIGPGMSFADFGAGIDYLARLLATRYPIDSGDLARVGSIYAACGVCWGSTTGSIMQARFGASPYALRYPSRE